MPNPSEPVPGAPGVVFDCPVYVQAFLSIGGPAFACLELAEAGIVTLFVSGPVLDEVAGVIARPAIRRGRRTITRERIQDFLDRVVLISHRLDEVPPVFSYPRDPKDEQYVNLAVAARAQYLVTWDNHLLDLMKENNAEGSAFRERFRGLTVLTPPGLLRFIAGR